jgi:hypothetical protein
MAVAYLEHGFTTDRAKESITFPLTLRELEEADEYVADPAENGGHAQGRIGDECIAYRPGQDPVSPDTLRQGKAGQSNMKEVGENTEDYFKRTDVFPGSGRIRNGQAS